MVLSSSCLSVLKAHKKEARAMTWNRHPQCDNLTTLSGYSPSQFQKVHQHSMEKNEINCMSPVQERIMNNTYTKRPVSLRDHLPLSFVLKEKNCPDFVSPPPKQKDILYVSFRKPVDWTKKSPTKALLTYDPENPGVQSELLDYSLFLAINTRFVYQIEWKKSKSKKKIPFSKRSMAEVKSITWLHPKRYPPQKQVFEIPLKTPIHDALRTFFRGSSSAYNLLSRDMIQDITNLQIHLKTPLTLYRGILLTLPRCQELGLENARIGQKYTWLSKNVPVSWTVDPCVAKYFATHKVMQFEMPAVHLEPKIGIIFRKKFQPDEILLDSRLINNENFHTMGHWNQLEVIARPNLQQPLHEMNLEFLTTVDQIFIILRNKDILPVKNLVKIFPYLLHLK